MSIESLIDDDDPMAMPVKNKCYFLPNFAMVFTCICSVHLLVSELAQAKYVMPAFQMIICTLQNTQNFGISCCCFAEDA